MPIPQDEVFKKCNELGESKVRENLNSNIWNTSKQKHAKEWLRQLEIKRSDDALSKQEDREVESIKVARDANSIAANALSRADDANDIAKDALRIALHERTITIIAAIAAIVAAIAAIVAAINAG